MASSRSRSRPGSKPAKNQSRSFRSLPEVPSESGSAPAAEPGRPAAEDSTPIEGPSSDGSDSFWRRHRRVIGWALAVIVTAGFVYYGLPRIIGIGPTLQRLRGGDIWWLALGVVLEAVSIFGEIALFHGLFARPGNRINWRVSYRITMAGTAATKLLATAGAGGIALTVWALRSFGLSGEEVATGMVCYEILIYAVYMGALAVTGYGLWLGLFSGRAPFGMTVVPAIFATAVILIVVSMLFAYSPAEKFLLGRAERSHGKAAARWRRAAAWPRSIHAGLVAAIDVVKRRDRSLLGAFAYWGFDIGTLWASFHAFGHSPPGAVLVIGYFVGTLGNTLPLPGGVGGVEGGMIAAFLAFGVASELAVLAVLSYRTISYWLPTLPGAVAYWQLRREIGTSRDQARSPDDRSSTAR